MTVNRAVVPAFPSAEAVPHHLLFSRGGQRPPGWRCSLLLPRSYCGPRRVLSEHSTVSRVSRAIAVDVSIKGDDVVAVLDRLKRTAGCPERLAVDNGPEIVSKALGAWAYRNGVTLEVSRPGKPTDNAPVESFNGHVREECLDQHWFETRAEAREVIEAWRVEYNEGRPQRPVGLRRPAALPASGELAEKAAD